MRPALSAEIIAFRLGLRQSAPQWLPYFPELREHFLRIYGAEPLLCAAVHGMSLAEFLTRLNALEAECQRMAGIEPAVPAAKLRLRIRGRQARGSLASAELTRCVPTLAPQGRGSG